MSARSRAAGTDTLPRLVRSILDERFAADLREAAIAHLSSTGIRELEARCHPLGFVDLPLFEDDAVAVKLHIWHPRIGRTQVPQPICHSHGWPLRSTVLCGCLENRTYPVRVTAGGSHRLYRVAHVAPYSISLATATYVHIGEPVTTVVAAATTYRIPAGVFHSTAPGAGTIVVTAVVADLRDRSDALLALRRGEPARHFYERRRCSTSERDLLGHAVLDRLESEP